MIESLKTDNFSSFDEKTVERQIKEGTKILSVSMKFKSRRRGNFLLREKGVNLGLEELK